MLTIWARVTSSNIQALMWRVGELGLPESGTMQGTATAHGHAGVPGHEPERHCACAARR